MMISKISNVKFKPYFGINQRKNGENIQKDKNNNINSPQKDDTISDVILSLLLFKLCFPDNTSNYYPSTHFDSKKSEELFKKAVNLAKNK